MNNKFLKVIMMMAIATLLPLFSHAEGIAGDLHSLQGILRMLYEQMMPLCSGLIGISRGIAGFAALFYIGARVWRHIAANEPVDIYPLLRPFALGFCILMFPSVLNLMNGILQPVVTATESMVQNTNAAVARLTQDTPDDTEGNELDQNDPNEWYRYSHPDNADNNSNPISSAFAGWGIKNWVRKFIAEVLNILFQAAALCLDTIRTFKLIVLSILGPLCFGFSVFDGFQHTLKQWIARYVNVFMWLPVANIFGAIIGKIQENMIIAANSGDLPGNGWGNENTAYLIFLLIAIVGYFTVPSIANYIMNVGGHALFNRTSAVFSQATSFVTGMITKSALQSEAPMSNKLTGNTKTDKS